MRRACVVLLSAAAAVLLTQPGWAEPKISFTDTSVIAEGITPGGQAVWFSLARERPGWVNQSVRRDAVLDDDDGDGAVTLQLDCEVPRNSIWAVVDLATGERAVAAPEDMPLRVVDLPGNSLLRSPRGAVEVLQDDRQFLEILVVRPGAGAWQLSVGDGGASDADRDANGSIQASFSAMRGVETSSAAPQQLLPGDVLIVIDPRRMEHYAATFGRSR